MIRYLFFLSVLSLSLDSLADDKSSIHGEFKFEDRVPPVSVIFLADNHESSVKDVEVDQKDKLFTNAVYFGPQKSQIIFKNSDEVQHNVFINEKDPSVNIDIGLADPKSKTLQPLTWPNGTMVKMSCKIHPKMVSYLASIDSKYVQVMDFEKDKKNLKFTIADVPNKFQTIKILIPRYDPLEIPNVKSKFNQTLDLTKDKKKQGQITLTR